MARKQRSIDKPERSIPERAARATKVAYKSALRSGRSVLIAVNGKIIRVHPDASREVIREISRSYAVKKGKRIRIK